MGFSTKNVSLADDISSDTCKGCTALRVDVEMHGQKVRSVRLHCEIADVAAADCSSLFERMKRIRAAARKVLDHAIDPDTEYGCEALRNAAYILSEIEENRERQRKLRPIPDEVVWGSSDGSDARRWLAAQGRKLKE